MLLNNYRYFGALLCFAIVSLSACTNGNDKSLDNGAIPVRAQNAVVSDFPVQEKTIGAVEAASSVSVTAQVSGVIVSVHFTEGQNVKQGDLLFTIDDRLYVSELNEKQANLEKEKAQAQTATSELKRNEQLLKKNFISVEQYDKAKANALALQAAVRAREAEIESAKLKLEYTKIKSPLDGRAGNVLIKSGNLVNANDKQHPLVIIHQVKPILVRFSLPDKVLDAIRSTPTTELFNFPVSVMTAKNQKLNGNLNFVNNEVDSSTGTILLKAILSNEDEQLLPGAFVQISLTLSTNKNAVVVPLAAVQHGQDGDYVFIVNSDGIARYQVVRVGQRGDDTVEILEGLKGGEQVVTDGHIKIKDGAKVEVVQNEG